MSAAERDRLLARIGDLQLTLRYTRSADVRRTIEQALADCEKRLATAEGELAMVERERYA